MSTTIFINGKYMVIDDTIYSPSAQINRVRRPNSKRYVAADKECNRLNKRIKDVEDVISFTERQIAEAECAEDEPNIHYMISMIRHALND
jgi:hypothetical protein